MQVGQGVSHRQERPQPTGVRRSRQRTPPAGRLRADEMVASIAPAGRDGDRRSPAVLCRALASRALAETAFAGQRGDVGGHVEHHGRTVKHVAHMPYAERDGHRLTRPADLAVQEWLASAVTAADQHENLADENLEYL